MARACLCGRLNCRVHGRRSHGGGSHVYGAEHQERRRRMLAQTPEICARCGKGPIPGDPWEAGHIQAAALGGGPEVRREHRSCNRRHGAQLLAQLKKQAADRRAEERIRQTMRLLGRSA